MRDRNESQVESIWNPPKISNSNILPSDPNLLIHQVYLSVTPDPSQLHRDPQSLNSSPPYPLALLQPHFSPKVTKACFPYSPGLKLYPAVKSQCRDQPSLLLKFGPYITLMEWFWRLNKSVCVLSKNTSHTHSTVFIYPSEAKHYRTKFCLYWLSQPYVDP